MWPPGRGSLLGGGFSSYLQVVARDDRWRLARNE